MRLIKQKNNALTEDDVKDYEKDIQVIIDEATKELEKVSEEKETEMLGDSFIFLDHEEFIHGLFYFTERYFILPAINRAIILESFLKVATAIFLKKTKRLSSVVTP